MKIRQLRLKNFQSFGSEPATIELEELTYVLGPNGAGKTMVLEALSRLFSPLAAQRKVRVEDFRVPVNRSASDVHAEQPTLWLEADVGFPDAGEEGQHASNPPNFSHMAIASQDSLPRVRLPAVLAADRGQGTCSPRRCGLGTAAPTSQLTDAFPTIRAQAAKPKRWRCKAESPSCPTRLGFAPMLAARESGSRCVSTGFHRNQLQLQGREKLVPIKARIMESFRAYKDANKRSSKAQRSS